MRNSYSDGYHMILIHDVKYWYAADSSGQNQKRHHFLFTKVNPILRGTNEKSTGTTERDYAGGNVD